MRRWVGISLLAMVLGAVPHRADAVTLQEIIDLTRAGLGEETLLALIEIDPRVYPIDAETLQKLKGAGVSEKVIVAMIKSGRTPAPPPEPAPLIEPEPDPVPPPPQVIVVEREPRVREVAVPVAVPVYIPVDRSHSRHGRDVRDDDRRPQKPAAPVYWGFGGKLRPDAWTPAPAKSSEKSSKSDRQR
jgi:hypothetical protein